MSAPLKVHGGKHYLAQRLVALMPPHTHYVEPYAGGLAVLLAKSPAGVSEVINDLDRRYTNFWHVLQDPDLFTSFVRRVHAMPVSQSEWQLAQRFFQTAPPPADPRSQVEWAVRFFVLCRQSLAGRCQEFTPLSRNRTRRGMNEQAAAWLSAVEGLPEVHARLQRVVVLNQPALAVLRSQDEASTLFYLDPPYVPEARTAKGVFGQFEMTVEQHEELLAEIVALQGMVMISGYASSLYDSWLAGWHRSSFDLPNNAGRGSRKRRMQEIVWCNFKPIQQQKESA